MSAERLTHTGTVVRQVFEVLLRHPEGLHFREILRLIDRTVDHSNSTIQLTPDQIACGCIAPIKAGWLISNKDVFLLSPSGIEAYSRFQDPSKFLVEAGRSSFKGWLSVSFPSLYHATAKALDQLTAEYQVMKRLGLRQLFGELVQQKKSWQEILPLQTPRRVLIDDVRLSDNVSFVDYLKSLPFSCWGRHAVYLPPQAIRQSGLRVITELYPTDAGLKIVKNQGGIEESNYITGKTKGDSVIQLALVHTHRHLTLVANLLNQKGIGPRLYDLVELQCNGELWTAYVVAHVEGETPSLTECEEVIEKLKGLEADGLLKVILPDGFKDEEFECPSCSGNVVKSESDSSKYVDFQNFRLANYPKYLKKLAVEATNNTHFGDRLILRGGRYLYQTIPGVRMSAKRDIEKRMSVLSRLMEEANVSVEDRLVLDIGCNIGMMMAQYLKLRAKWCHGWDRTKVIAYSDQILSALGCTRFSLSGTDLTSSHCLEDDLPSFLLSSLNGCIISYLAVRAHVGWLDALARIPWSCLIYEGHEGESREDLDQYIIELKNLTDCRLTCVADYIDGDSEQRTVALVVRADT